MTELQIERMVHGGVGLARVPGGRIVLVPGVIPGEVVKVELSEEAGVLRGKLQEVVARSADRVPAPSHPGLDYGHIGYPRQVSLKAEVVLDALQRAVRSARGENPHDPVVALVDPAAAPLIWRYRNAIQPAAASGGLGYRLPRSAQVVRLESDPVANEALERSWRHLAAEPLPKGVREIAMRGNDSGEVLVALVATSPQRSLLPFAHGLIRKGVAVGVAYARYDARGRFRGGSERLAGKRQIEQLYGRLPLTVSVSSFAQPNPSAAGRLYLELSERVGQGRFAFELFSGGGAIALHLADRFERVAAVEIDRASVARGRADAQRLGVDNVDFLPGDARAFDIPEGADLVAVDPPRSGLSREVREAITRSNAQRLAYVSCDPATWARDVADLLGQGWRLDFARPYDLYPHTHHVEMLSFLSR